MSTAVFMSRFRSLFPHRPSPAFPEKQEHAETACELFGAACKAERRATATPFPSSAQLARERADNPPPPKTFALVVSHR